MRGCGPLLLLLGLDDGECAKSTDTATASFVFDVASIKPGSAERRTRIFRHPDDAEFGAQNVSLKALVQFAYGVTEARVLGFPAALLDARFDVQAHPDLTTAARFRALKPDENREAKQHMVEDLLVSRCHLKVHGRDAGAAGLRAGGGHPERAEIRRVGGPEQQLRAGRMEPHRDRGRRVNGAAGGGTFARFRAAGDRPDGVDGAIRPGAGVVG